MFRRLIILAVSLAVSAVIVLPVTAVNAQAAYAPRPGPMFNNPYGGRYAQNNILVHIRQAIAHAPTGAMVQLAAYSFNRGDIAKTIVHAYRRGVHVQMVLNDNWITKQTRHLEHVLGTDINQPSFVKVCYQSCRGGAGNQHAKFYLFSQTGSARNVVMVGSANLTGHAARSQFNDMLTLLHRRYMRRDYDTIFRQLAEDRRVAHPWRVFQDGNVTSRFYPHPNTTASTDPVMRRLNHVSCRAINHTGSHGHTLIRIARYGWQGSRGLWLAQKVARLEQHGCWIHVIVSSAGRQVVGTLRRAGVAVKDADTSQRADGSFRKYTHEKWMILDGTFNGVGIHKLWTGSENWSNMSLRNDEVVLEIPGVGRYYDYARHFAFEWKYHTHWFS